MRGKSIHWSALFCNFINTRAYQLGWFKPSSPSTKGLHGCKNNRSFFYYIVWFQEPERFFLLMLTLLVILMLVILASVMLMLGGCFCWIWFWCWRLCTVCCWCCCHRCRCFGVATCERLVVVVVAAAVVVVVDDVAAVVVAVVLSNNKMVNKRAFTKRSVTRLTNVVSLSNDFWFTSILDNNQCARVWHMCVRERERKIVRFVRR